jgi:hypothetical protein
MLDQQGVPYFLEANRCSHMLWEYVGLYGDDEPFRRTAAWMNAADGPPCLLWRRTDPPAGEVEHACWIAGRLTPYLRQPPLVAFVEDNQEGRAEIRTREGDWARVGSLFRWWYPLPWSYERSGVRVVNPNAVWVTVRDKLASYARLSGAAHFRVPRSWAVDSAAEAAVVLAENDVFARGFVLKPRTGFGGHGVRVGETGETPEDVPPHSMLCERVVPALDRGRFWDVRLFVMAGTFCGGLVRTSERPVTNVFQGGTAARLPDDLAGRLEPAALEAVRLLDEAAAEVHALERPPESHLTRVVW